ncbi:hypothetical protein GDO86_010894 [Hymenochirus boettgeri]|uniref:Palmitoyltransferase n=1 Tax=Hymenochirus boettgeri TaxID=247094 RepID=A0A8T2JC13_9PIPI|nr:hypothetical protein GDO86_010894 [Hymenochirus boettgeri]
MACVNQHSFCKTLLSYINILIILILLDFSYGMFNILLCIFTVTSLTEKACYLAVSHFLLVMLVWSFIRTMRTPPATPPRCFHWSKAMKVQYKTKSEEEFQVTLCEAAMELPIIMLSKEGNIRFCSICQLIQPDRCHHCVKCNMCVLKKDHHCVWLHNCVGFSNYKYFLLTLLYAILYLLFISAASLQYVIKIWAGKLPDALGSPLLALVCLSLIVLILVLFLLLYTCFNIGRNRTTIEANYPPSYVNCYDQNAYSFGFCQNLLQVLGEKKRYWLFPVFTSLGDGYSFPMRCAVDDVEKNAGIFQVLPARPLWITLDQYQEINDSEGDTDTTVMEDKNEDVQELEN